MRLTKEEKEICKKFSVRDKDGYVHCIDCPLAMDLYQFDCKKTVTAKEWKEYIEFLGR